MIISLKFLRIQRPHNGVKILNFNYHGGFHIPLTGFKKKELFLMYKQRIKKNMKYETHMQEKYILILSLGTKFDKNYMF